MKEIPIHYGELSDLRLRVVTYRDKYYIGLLNERVTPRDGFYTYRLVTPPIDDIRDAVELLDDLKAAAKPLPQPDAPPEATGESGVDTPNPSGDGG